MEDTSELFELIVDAEGSGTRLDRYLVTQLPEMSRSRIQDLMDQGRVRVDGTARKPSYRITQGDLIEIEIPADETESLAPEPIPLEVLYEDEEVAVVNKPARMIVHPGAGETSGTLAAALLYRFSGSAHLSDVGGPKRPGIVHRLDKDTSGALLIARTNAAHRRLTEEFSEREIQKIYVALLHGNLKENSGRIELPVARDLNRRTRMTTRRREGRPARTDWRTLLRIPGFILVAASLHTGRTHQLRVHFSSQGHPVVGDTLYGAPREPHAGPETLPPLERNFLHAARITFVHPRRNEPVEVRAPLPAELGEYLHRIGAAAGFDGARIDAALHEFL